MLILGRYGVRASEPLASAEVLDETPESLKQKRLMLERKLQEVEEALQRTEEA